MDKRTRVLSAMNKLPVDHVPVSFWYHFKGEEMLGEPCVQAHVRYFEEADVDFIKIMCDSYFPRPLPKIREATDWYKLEPLDREAPYIRDQVWRAKRIVEEIGDRCCTFYTLFAPFSTLRFSAPDELVMSHLKQDENAVLHALDVLAQDNALLGELLLREAGCDGAYFCVQGGEASRMPEKEYRRLIMPSDRYVLDRINRFSDNNIMHCCGWAGERNCLELWKDYPSKAVNWAVHVEELSLPEGRALFGDRCCLGGFETLHQHDNVYKGMLYTASKEEIKNTVREIILQYGKRGLMIGGDCILSPDVSNERIKWVVEAAREI